MKKTLLCAVSMTLALGSLQACKKKEAPVAQDTTPAYEGNLFAEGFSEQSIAGTLKTAKPASEVAEGCPGFLGDEATMEFRIASDMPMEIAVLADIDAVMVIEGPEGPHCQDDGKGSNPALGRTWKAGDYRLWVGSFEAQSEAFFYEAAFSHFDPNADPQAQIEEYFANLNKGAVRAPSASEAIVGADASILDTHNNPLVGAVFIAPNAAATEYAFEVPAGPRSFAHMVSDKCDGYINYNQPEKIVNFTGGGPLNIILTSEDDTTLVVHGPNGSVWCADDVLDKNPALLIEDAPEGAYHLWFGVKDPGPELVRGALTVY